MEMHQVLYFVTLCETLNFTRAAERCHVAQPSLTRAIRQLEEELGGPLFNRERNNTHLTELGRLMEPHLREVLDQSRAARARAGAFFELKTARLRLGLARGVAPRLVDAAVRRFAARHPDTEITLIDAPDAALRDQLRQGELEVVVLPTRPADIDDLHYYPIGADRMQVLVQPGHPFAALAEVPLGALAGETLIVREGCLFYEAVERRLRERRLAVRPLVTVGTEAWLAILVEDGLGVAITGLGHGVPPGLVGRSVAGLDTGRDVNLATKRGRLYSPPVKAFVDTALRPPRPMPTSEIA
jgi:DNA-binding transcriptional LysR family regulator